MSDDDVEKAIARLIEARRAEAFAKRIRMSIEDELNEAGIECNHTVAGTSWRRVRSAANNGVRT